MAIQTAKRATIVTDAAEAARLELDRRQRARAHLLNFACYTYPAYRPARVHRFLCGKLDAVAAGDCRRLMIFFPPRHGKSELASKRFPAFFLGKYPSKNIISASYGSDLAGDFGRDVRNIIAAQPFRALFPDVRLSQDSTARDRWHTNSGGGYVAAGVGTATTGRGAHVFNIDDPVKDKIEAESETTRDKVWDWYRTVAHTRLEGDSSIVLTMTRWHPDDLAGRLLREMESGEGDRFEVVNLPAFAIAGDPLGRSVGEPLWPEKYNTADLEQKRRVMGDTFGALYDQDPQPPGSAFFDEERLLVDGRPVERLAGCDAVFAVVDTAVKTGKRNDGTAVVYFGVNKRSGAPLIVLDWDVVQVQGSLLEEWLPGVAVRLEELAMAHNARAGNVGIWVEDKSSGTILLQQMAKQATVYRVHAIDTRLTAMGKDERAVSVSGYVTGGRVKILADAYNRVRVYKGRVANHFVLQVLGFRLATAGQTDDLLDAFCYGVALALGNKGGF